MSMTRNWGTWNPLEFEIFRRNSCNSFLPQFILRNSFIPLSLHLLFWLSSTLKYLHYFDTETMLFLLNHDFLISFGKECPIATKYKGQFSLIFSRSETVVKISTFVPDFFFPFPLISWMFWNRKKNTIFHMNEKYQISYYGCNCEVLHIIICFVGQNICM